jgi:RNA-splicing ligase RtcB
MLELRGKYNTALVYTDNIEQAAISQIIEICSMAAFKDSKIRVMPDVHAGKGCTVGTTMTITHQVVPSIVGVDIGCGMHVVEIASRAEDIDLAKLDKVIKKYVPLGTEVRDVPFMKFYDQIKDELLKLDSASQVDLVRAKLSMGTLGGGNHFIEMDVADNGRVYLVIHTGSRKAGTQVCEYHQNAAYKDLTHRMKDKSALVDLLNSQGRQQEIQAQLKKLAPVTHIPKALAYVEGDKLDAYLRDMRIMQKFADLNRKAIAQTITVGMRWNVLNSFTTIHNYIDLNNMILRKGAISAQEGEVVLIPINNEDGALICVGKGNADWNFSAPHGAGRLMSRSKAKATLSLEKYQQGLKDAGVYTTTANKSTLDESKQAYKPIDEIIANIGGTVDIVQRIKPFYNIKAGEED